MSQIGVAAAVSGDAVSFNIERVDFLDSFLGHLTHEFRLCGG